MKQIRYLLLLTCVILIFPGCGSEQKKSALVIGISSDPESINALYAFSGNEINITEILYPSLIQMDWDSVKGALAVSPLLADKFVWGKNSLSVDVHLKKGITWSDGKELTADDVIFSFDLFSDPLVQSRLYGIFKNFRTDENLKILPESFRKINKYAFTVFFREKSNPSLIDLDLPVLPKHIYEGIKRDNIVYAEKEIKPVLCGPFLLKAWNKNQSVVLVKNPKSFLVNEKTPDEIIFKVVPDYNSRITQLKNNEIDLAEDIKTDDVEELGKYKNIVLGYVKGREYDYAAWNNIDPAEYSADKKIKENNLFGNAEVRKALTLGINRFEIVKDYLLNYGQAASSPVSPVFKDSYDENIRPYPYDPYAAREILKSEGWRDIDNDGILEKGNIEFSFTLNIPSGNPRRDFTAALIKNNLRMIGIDLQIEPIEPSVFFEKMFNRELNAWIAGWSIPVPQYYKTYWYSNLEEAPFNAAGFMNRQMDSLLIIIENEKDSPEKDEHYKEMQAIFYEQNPVTFLFWIDNIVAYNSRIKKIHITPLGAVHHIWEWETDD